MHKHFALIYKMPFDVGQSVNAIADSILRAPITRSIAENPIYTALVITVIVIIMTCIIFRNSSNDNPLLTMAVRLGFWVFLSASALIFLHDKILSNEIYDTTKVGAYQDLFADKNLTTGQFDSLIVPVLPN